MDEHTSHEQAYKNGYDAGYEAGKPTLIPVTDEQKPKQGQECLCVCCFEDDLKQEWRWYCVLRWHDIPYQDNGIVNRPHFTDEGVDGMVVTHWMPLPELPTPIPELPQRSAK